MALFTFSVSRLSSCLFVIGLLLGVCPAVSAQVQKSQTSQPDSTVIEAEPADSTNGSIFKPQKYLVLDKPGRTKRIRYYKGSEIVFKLKGDRIMYSDPITEITDSTITIFNTPVYIRDIDKIFIYHEGWFIRQGSVMFPLAGALYLVMAALNPAVSGGKAFQISTGTAIVSGSLIGGGLLLKAFARKGHKIGKRKRLSVMNTF